MLERARLRDERLLGAGEPGEEVQHRHRALRGLRRREDREAHVAVVHLRGMLVVAQLPAVAGVPGDRREQRHQALSVPFCFATCVAIASINVGDSASYGGSRSFFSRSRTFFMSFGRAAPASMMDDTKAANSGLFQPLSFDSSTCTKSSP